MFSTDDTIGRIASIDLQREGGWGLFLRHAERYPIRTTADVMSAGLTDPGRMAARNLGHQLRELPIGLVISSPVRRCVDTAMHILEGRGDPVVPTESRILIDDTLVNAFIENGRLAEEEYTRRDPELVILCHLAGETVPGLVDISEGANRLLHLALNHIATRTLTLFITHDSMIMPFRSHFCSARYSSANWQPYLTGALVYAHGQNVEVDGIPAAGEGLR